MDVAKIKKVHCLGIGGIGVSAVAKFFLAQGKIVTGSDVARSEITRDLEKRGVSIFYGHRADNVASDTDLVIYSPAVPPDNPERLKISAQGGSASGGKILSYPEFLGELSKNYYTIAISGTHGKSTTTAMIGLILEAAELDPLVIVGSRVPGWELGNIRLPKNGHPEFISGSREMPKQVWHNKKQNIFVVEACEHQANMLKIHPQIAVVTNIESDHLDYYQNLENIIEAFGKFVRSVPEKGKVFINSDDKNSKRLAIGEEKKRIFGFDDSLRLNIPGRFNVYNSSAARAVAMELGVSDEICQKVLADFRGIWRRFEIVRQNPLIISDYGHHPTAIRETLKATREFYPGQRIVLVYQPHQHHRTKMLFKDFVQALALPDVLILSDIYDVAGREEAIDQDVNSAKLLEAVKASGGAGKYHYGGNLVETEKKIRELIQNDDVILVMGAGDIDKVARNLVVPVTVIPAKAGIQRLSIQKNVSLSQFTTFKIGGPAQYFVAINKKEDLSAALSWAKEKGLLVLILGGGSNLLINDEGFPGLVIRISLGGWSFQGQKILGGAGVLVADLAQEASRRGLRGLEWAGGLPGTLGGAVRGNAGAFRFEISQVVKKVEVWRQGQIVNLDVVECGFGYRTSLFKTALKDDIILNVELALTAGDKEESGRQLADFLFHREKKQPIQPSAGCVFKNFCLVNGLALEKGLLESLPAEFIKYKKIPAAWLVEKAGMKGAQMGQAQVSTEHANFIINLGGAKASEVKELIRQIKDKVYNKYHLQLEEEVQII